MTALAQKLDRRLSTWRPEVVEEVSSMIAEVIELADADGLDLLRSRRVEQEVLDLLDEAKTR
jgi:hypothetical protein